MVACAHEAQHYAPDLEQLEEVERRVRESSFETPTLGDPFVALTEHQAFMGSYFGGNSEVIASSLHRLGDLYMIRENRSYERALKRYIQRLRLYKQDRLRESPMPPMPSYLRSLRIYEKLLQDFSNYPGNDRVLYQLARIYEATEEPQRRDEALERLVKEYPKSRHASEVHFRLAEIYFTQGRVEEAAAAYETAAANLGMSTDVATIEQDRAPEGTQKLAKNVLEEAQMHGNEERALYKSAWAQMNLSDYPKAIDMFRTLLDRKWSEGALDDKAAGLAKWDFAQEILRSMVIAFSQWGSLERIRVYFDTIGNREYEHLIYRKLGDFYRSQKKITDAVKVYDDFLKTHPKHPEAPAVGLEIIQAYQDLQLIDLSNRARTQFIDMFGKGSEWYQNASLEDRQKIRLRSKQIFYQLALFYHSEAQKTDRSKDYDRAIRWHTRFLSDFPKEAQSSRIHFLYAEALYEQKRFQMAAVEYEKTAYGYPQHQYSAESGYASILALDKLLTRLDTSETKAEEDSLILSLAQACERFVDDFPSDERVLDVQLKGAEFYTRAGHYQKTRELAEAILKTQTVTSHPGIVKAQRLIANSYFQEEAFVQAAEAYRKIDLTVVSDEERQEVKQLWGAALYKQAEGLKADGKLEEAAAAFYQVQREMPVSDVAPVALYDAGLIAMEREDIQSSLQAFGILIRQYPQSDLSKKVPAFLLQVEQDFLDKGQHEKARLLAEEVKNIDSDEKGQLSYQAQRLIANNYFEKGAYDVAAELYRKLDSSKASVNEEKEVRRLWASALYKQAEGLKADGKLEEAEVAFYQVQREMPVSDVAPVALYDAGLIAMEREDIQSSLQAFGILIRQYPQSDLSKKVPAFLLQVEQDFLDKGQHEKARLLAEEVKNIDSDEKGQLSYQAQRLIANNYFEKGAYDVAAELYRKLDSSKASVNEEKEVRRLWASALYKQAEGLKADGKLEEAEVAFYQVQREMPVSEVAPVALYDAGLIAVERGNLDGALEAFNLLIRKYPLSPHYVHAALQVARIREKQGNLMAAAMSYQKIPQLTKDRRMISEALLTAGLLYEQLKKWVEAGQLYQDYLDHDPGQFEKIVEVRFKLIQIKQHLNQHEQARPLFMEFIEQYSSDKIDPLTSGGETDYYIAKARLELAHYLLQEYKAVKLVSPLEDNLAKKRQLLTAVLDPYMKAAEHQIVEITTEATYRIGEAFEQFRTALLESERPSGLTPQQLEQYGFLLEERAFPFEEKAIAAYEANVKRTQQLGVYDEWIRRSYGALSLLMPGRYLKPEFPEVLTPKLFN